MVHVPRVCTVLSFACHGVFSFGWLVEDGIIPDLAALTLTFPNGVVIPIVSFGALYFVDAPHEPALAVSLAPAPPPQRGVAFPALGVRTFAAAPPLHGGDNLMPPPRFARGMPLDRATLHAALDHASDETTTAMLAAYGVSAVSCTRPPCCGTCTAPEDIPRAPTSSVSRMQPLPGSIFRRWQLDLVEPIAPASSLGARYLIHAFQPNSELEWGAAISAKVGDSKFAARAHHAAFTARGLAPLVYESDLGGEFRGDAWDAIMTDLGVRHEARAPEAHVGGVELAHRHSFRFARAASRAANAPAYL